MLLENLGDKICELAGIDKAVIVTDENIKRLYLNRCIESLQQAELDTNSFVIAPGEDSKDGKTYLELINFLAENQLTRTDCLVALGGGVVGDLAGFAAATYLRGIKVVQVPTTLLAAVDSSIGGKTAINLPAGKNLAGAFHQPSLILNDESLIDSLPDEDYRDGMSEVIKYGIISETELFENLEKQCARGQLRLSGPPLAEIIRRCAAIKKRFVEEDRLDTGTRQLLNFGHTIGHAVEKASDYTVSHGSAVAKGMAAMAHISEKTGWCSGHTARRIREILEKYRFDLTITVPKETLYDIIKADKKRKGRYIDIVVPEEIGRCRLQRLTIEEFGEII